jgi:hypothetical protein
VPSRSGFALVGGCLTGRDIPDTEWRLLLLGGGLVPAVCRLRWPLVV